MSSTVQPLVHANSNTPDVNIAPDPGTMHADQVKVRQGMFKLLSNVVKFTQAGTITVDAGRERMDGREWIVCRVADTGIGMTPEQVVKPFQDLQQFLGKEGCRVVVAGDGEQGCGWPARCSRRPSRWT